MAAGDQQQQFCLRWNDFQSNIVTCFKHLRTERSFTDVTLACDAQTCKAHKMVLSACSPYFKSLLEVGQPESLFLNFPVWILDLVVVNIFYCIFTEQPVKASDYYSEGCSFWPLAVNFGIHVRWGGQCPTGLLARVSQDSWAAQGQGTDRRYVKCHFSQSWTN